MRAGAHHPGIRLAPLQQPGEALHVRAKLILGPIRIKRCMPRLHQRVPERKHVFQALIFLCRGLFAYQIYVEARFLPLVSRLLWFLAVCRICFDIYSAILTYFTMIHHEELSLL